MTYYIKLCDKTMNVKSRYKRFISIAHKSNNEPIIMRNSILNTKFHDFDAIRNRYIIKKK